MGETEMNILVTGDAGFIGKHITNKLLELGHTVSGYDLMRGEDIRNLHDLDKRFEYSQCTTVVHLAARAGVRRSIDYPEEYISTNVQGTWNVGKMCEKYNCRLINFSSSSVYGIATPPPIFEPAPKAPISLYGMTKHCAENIVNNLTIPTVIIRPFTVYGDGGRGDQVFYKWINQLKAGKNITAFKNDNSCRGYTYVDDLVDVIRKLIDLKWYTLHQDFNIGGQEVISIHDLVRVFVHNIPEVKTRITWLKAPKEDIAANYANINKAKLCLNFDPPRRFKQILSNIIQTEYHGK